MASNPSFAQRAQLAQEVRKRFVADAGRAMVEISTTVQERLTTLMNEAAPSREMQVRRDAWTIYQRARAVWLDGTMKAWQKALLPVTAPVSKGLSSDLELDGLQLVGTEVVENKIVASRLVLGVAEKMTAQRDDLRVRMRVLEGMEDLEAHDILRPEVLILQIVEQWAAAGMPRESWPLVQEVVQRLLIERLKAAYHNCNEFLIKQGVLPTIDLKDRVKRVPSANSPARAPRAPGQPPDAGPSTSGKLSGQSSHGDLGGYQGGYAGAQQGGQTTPSGRGGVTAPNSISPPASGRSAAGAFGGRLGWGGDPAVEASGASPQQPTPAGQPRGPGPQGGPSAPDQQHAASAYANANAHEETRMLTATTPLARARSRAQGVMGQLKRLLIGRAGSDFEATSFEPPTPALAKAIAARPVPGDDVYVGSGTVMDEYTPAGVARVAGRLREQTTELKNKAETKSEKATIEIVALMFQAILQEDRIPPAIRVWFARLQMPVLRVALEEPDFFGTLNHPARQLIDRMGSCVMGFDASGVQGTAMEAEIKRVVQVI